jgi:hypothetical protein
MRGDAAQKYQLINCNRMNTLVCNVQRQLLISEEWSVHIYTSKRQIQVFLEFNISMPVFFVLEVVRHRYNFMEKDLLKSGYEIGNNSWKTMQWIQMDREYLALCIW